jgi:hypothetical protein
VSTERLYGRGEVVAASHDQVAVFARVVEAALSVSFVARMKAWSNAHLLMLDPKPK